MSDLIIVSTPFAGVRAVALNRPERRNALNVATIEALGRFFSQSERDDDIRCVVLTGNEKTFSAGADISEMSKEGFAALDRPERKSAWSAIERFSKPLVAAAEGMALGGGLELLMLSDISIAGRSTKLGLPETKIGLIPGDGGTQRLTKLVGRPLASRMIFTGDPLAAEEAQRIGMISEVVDDGKALGRAIDLAAVISNGGTLRVANGQVGYSRICGNNTNYGPEC